METLKLVAKKREECGSAASRRLRRQGQLPANLTGLGQEPVALSVPEHEFELARHHGARLVELALEDASIEALIREIQFDTYGDRVLHVDFDRIERGHRIEVEVSFEFFGVPAGSEAGGVFQILMDGVTVECLPVAIPDNIEIDVRKMQIGDEVRISDVSFPEGVLPVDVEPDEIVALVSEAEAEEAEEEVEEIVTGGGSGEPELIRKAEKGEEEKD